MKTLRYHLAIGLLAAGVVGATVLWSAGEWTARRLS